MTERQPLSSPLANLLGFSVLGDTFHKRWPSGRYLGIVYLTVLKGNLKLNAKLINDQNNPFRRFENESRLSNAGIFSERNAVPIGKYILTVLSGVLPQATKEL